MRTLTTGRVAGLRGTLRPPSDKSLTHRAFMLASIASTESIVRDPLLAGDTRSTIHCLEQMGLVARQDGQNVVLDPSPWIQPETELDCGNSGTTMRLLSGLIAARPIKATLTGDVSLTNRPMGRIAEPLRLMGAMVEGHKPPLRIEGGSLHAIDYTLPVASAQIKSCIILAALEASGVTRITEPSPSRDHTERLLNALGTRVHRDGATLSVIASSQFSGFDFSVPADISSASFFMVAGALASNAHIRLVEVGLNPTRTGILDVFEQVGIKVGIDNRPDRLGEPVGDLELKTTTLLHPFDIEGSLVPRLIDEIPILAVLATQCDGKSTIRDAQELRVKESDRIALMVEGLKKMGAEIEATADGIIVTGPTPLHGAEIDAHLDHRIAMAFAVAGLIADGSTTISGAEAVETSYPDFEKDLWSLAVV